MDEMTIVFEYLIVIRKFNSVSEKPNSCCLLLVKWILTQFVIFSLLKIHGRNRFHGGNRVQIQLSGV